MKNYVTNYIVVIEQCNRTVKAANHTKSTQLDPPITELNTITIATIPTKLGNSKIEEFFTSDDVSTGGILPIFNFALFPKFGSCSSLSNW